MMKYIAGQAHLLNNMWGSVIKTADIDCIGIKITIHTGNPHLTVTHLCSEEVRTAHAWICSYVYNKYRHAYAWMEMTHDD